MPLPNKVSCFVSTSVFSANSFLSVRQEPTLRPWKGSHFLQHVQCAGERNQEKERQTETRPTGNLAFDPLPHAHHSPCLPTYPPIFTHLVFITMAKACGGTRTRKSIYQDVTKATENPLSHYTLYWALNCRKASTGTVPLGWQVGTAAIRLDLEGRRPGAWTAARTLWFKGKKEQRNSKEGWAWPGQGEALFRPWIDPGQGSLPTSTHPPRPGQGRLMYVFETHFYKILSV